MAIIPSKCHFGVTSAKYLGFILVPGGKTLSTQITDRIKEKLHNIWTEGCQETDKTKVIKYTQRILGTLVYFQQFIPRFTVKARFLFTKLSTGAAYTKDDQEKLQKIIDELAEHHTIYTPDWNIETEIFTDASNYHMGYAAFQNHKIVDLGSKKLQTKKVIASTIEREMATIRYAINRLKPMVDLKKATIYTDHNPIIGILKSPLHKLPNALASIVDEIARSQAKIVYINGKNNILADALSRRNMEEEPTKNFQVNKRPEMNDVETNPGPHTPTYEEILGNKQMKIRAEKILMARALFEVDKRKRQKGEKIEKKWMVQRVVELEEKEKIMEELQNPVPGRKTHPEILQAYEQIHPYTWLQLANTDNHQINFKVMKDQKCTMLKLTPVLLNST